MRVEALWRYPVKSAQGDRLSRAVVGPAGVSGDRSWAVVDVATGYALTARREPRLLELRAVTAAGPDQGADHARPVVGPFDGDALADDAALSRWLGRDVALDAAQPGRRAAYENLVDFEHEDASDWVTWKGPRGSFHDSTRTQVSIVSQRSIGEWDVRRFRPNLLLDGEDEDALVGHRVQLGSVVLDVVKQIDRCVVTTRPQPGGLGRDLDVLREINRSRASFLGVGAMVVTTGHVAVGDTLHDLGPSPTD